MSKQFEISRDVVVEATPEQVFAAVTDGLAGWLFPGKTPPADGSVDETGSRVTRWDPPHAVAVRTEGEDGWFNALEHIIDAGEGGTAVLHYVHSGVFADDWDNQFDAASTHTDFYLHSLNQYLKYFPGRAATYVAYDPSNLDAGVAGDTATLLRALGGSAVGDKVSVELEGFPPVIGTLDYVNDHFVGFRTDDGLYRFYNRTAWGYPVSYAHHLFGDADASAQQGAWTAWLNRAFA